MSGLGSMGAVLTPPPSSAWKYPVPFKGIGASAPARSIISDVSTYHNQGNIGSCVANAIATCLEVLCRRQSVPVELSRLQMYYDARAVRGWQGQDSGSFPEDMLVCASTIGAASETLWAYDPPKFSTRPPQDVYDSAKKHRAGNHYRAMTLDARIMALSNGALVEGSNRSGFPVAFSCMLPSRFNDTASTGFWPAVSQNEYGSGNGLGGHEMTIIGYDRSKSVPGYSNPGADLVLQSWGTWSNAVRIDEVLHLTGALFWIPWDAYKEPNRFYDFHVVTLFDAE